MNNLIEFDVEYTRSDLEQMMLETSWLLQARNKIVLLGILAAGAGILIKGVLIVTCGAVLVAVSLGYSTLVLRMGRKSFESPFFSYLQHKTVDETGISTNWSEGNTRINWTQFLYWVETKTSYLLYETPFVACLIPKRCLSQDQNRLFRELLSSSVIRYVPKKILERLLKGLFAAMFVVLTLVYGLIAWTLAHGETLLRSPADRAILKWLLSLCQ